MRTFFILDDPMNRRAMRLVRVSAEKAPDDLELLHGKALPSDPVGYRDGEFGSTLKDVLWSTGWTSCVSDRFIGVLHNGEFTGWSTFRVRISDRHNHEISGYHGLGITGQSLDIDFTRSVRLERPAPNARGRPFEVFRGLYFDEDLWRGESIFFAHGFIVVTDLLREALHRAKITGISLRRSDEVELDANTVLSANPNLGVGTR